jgi:hypothetical protein
MEQLYKATVARRPRLRAGTGRKVCEEKMCSAGTPNKATETIALPGENGHQFTNYEQVGASRRHPRSGFPKQKEGTIKHAILRNEAKFREGLFFNQVAVRQAIARDFWSYFRRAILKNEANFCICDLRFAECGTAAIKAVKAYLRCFFSMNHRVYDFRLLI